MKRLMPRGRNEALVDAAVDRVWSVIADPTRVGEWSHETSTASWEAPHTAPVPGATFTATNRVGPMRWTRRNEVLAVEPGRSISWRTVPSRLYADSTRWTLTAEPVDGGTRIVQEFEILELHPVADRLIYLLMRPHRDRSGALTDDLTRIGDLAGMVADDAEPAG